MMNEDRIEAEKYNIIYADPPWRFKNYSMADRAQRGESWMRRNGRPTYDVMNHDDICALPVADITAKNAILFLWATYPKLNEALEVVRAWDFVYKTVGFTWVKTNPKGLKIGLGTLSELLSPLLGRSSFKKKVLIPPKLIEGWHFGLGYHTRQNPEICLLATRGKGLRRLDNAVPNLVVSPVARHSEKPKEVGERIKRLYGDLPSVELFARQRRAGWDIWGNQAPGGSDLELTTRS